jgi:hypothetical protein
MTARAIVLLTAMKICFIFPRKNNPPIYMNDATPSTSEVTVVPVSEKDVVVVATQSVDAPVADIPATTMAPVDVPATPVDVPATPVDVPATPVDVPATPVAVPVTTVSSTTDISGALSSLIAKAQADLSGAVLTNAFLVSLVPRFAAALHSYKTSGQEKKKVVVAALHSLICLAAPDQAELHKNVDSFVPLVLDALLEVVKGDVVFPKEAKQNWFVRGLLCCLAKKTQ